MLASNPTPNPTPNPISGDDMSCNRKEECSKAQEINGFLYAYGYKSAWSKMADIECIGGGVDIKGDSACREIGLLDVDFGIYIYGSLGLFKGRIQVDGEILGYGAGSIGNANITTSNSVKCPGAMSCSNAIITLESSGSGSLTQYIFGYGSMSLSYSIINSNGVDIEISFYGAFSAYGTHINCELGSACEINCFENGCYGLTTGGNGNLVINGGFSSGADKRIKCDDYQVNLLSILDKESDLCDICYESRTRDGQNTLSDNIIKTSNGNVCCRGSRSCKSESSTIYTILMGNNENNFDCGNLLCNGYESCKNTELDNSNIEYGNIYCNGYESCSSSLIHSNYNGNVHCSGDTSCADSEIFGGKNVYCSGQHGCKLAIINSTENIYISGNNGGENTKINSDGVGIMKVYILSQASDNVDKSMTIICEEGDECIIYCLVNLACKNVKIIQFECDNVYIDCDNDYYCPKISYKSTSGNHDCPS